MQIALPDLAADVAKTVFRIQAVGFLVVFQSLRPLAFFFIHATEESMKVRDLRIDFEGVLEISARRIQASAFQVYQPELVLRVGILRV